MHSTWFNVIDFAASILILGLGLFEVYILLLCSSVSVHKQNSVAYPVSRSKILWPNWKKYSKLQNIDIFFWEINEKWNMKFPFFWFVDRFSYLDRIRTFNNSEQWHRLQETSVFFFIWKSTVQHIESACVCTGSFQLDLLSVNTLGLERLVSWWKLPFSFFAQSPCIEALEVPVPIHGSIGRQQIWKQAFLDLKIKKNRLLW